MRRSIIRYGLFGLALAFLGLACVGTPAQHPAQQPALQPASRNGVIRLPDPVRGEHLIFPKPAAEAPPAAAPAPPAPPAPPAKAPQPLPPGPGQQGQPGQPPAAPPPEVFAGGRLPTGVAFEKLEDRERYSVNGVEVDRQACYAAIAGDGLVDDSKKPTIVVIWGDEARRKQAVDQIRAAFGDEYKYADGPPQDWWFRPGFQTAGNPTIYCQAPDGTTLHRQDDLAGGVEAAIEAIRKTNPKYDPTRDPDLRRTGNPLADMLTKLLNPADVNWALVGLVIVVLYFAIRK